MQYVYVNEIRGSPETAARTTYRKLLDAKKHEVRSKALAFRCTEAPSAQIQIVLTEPGNPIP